MDCVTSRKSWGLVGLGIILACMFFWMHLSREKWTPLQKHAGLAFTRPASPSSSANSFSIRIAGVDGVRGVPTIKCGGKIFIDVEITPLGEQFSEALLVVPRLRNQGADGFKWIDYQGCDFYLALGQNVRPDPSKRIKYRFKESFNLRAGEYTLRYYRYINGEDPESMISYFELLGEGSLVVLVPESGSVDCGLIPLSDEKRRMPVFDPEQ